MSGVRKKINHRAVFKSRTKSDDNAELSNAVVISARKTGLLNLSSKGLYTVPNRVWTINELTKDELKELHFELDYDHKDERWWEQEILKSLDLSSNCLTIIDTKIQCLADLVVLDLHSNLLEELPPEIGSLRRLEKLNLSCNKLERLPAKFYELIELRELNLKNNTLKDVDPAIGDLIMLIDLNLSYNNLDELPVGMGYLVRLVSFDLSHNSLTELPPDVTNMRALRKLNASANQLETVPPFGEMRKLEAVMLQSNNLTEFPNVSGCGLLKELHLSDNKIKEIDMTYMESIGPMKKLTLANNEIKSIPDEIIQLISLEIFDVSHNNISVIPSSIGIMPNLKQFMVDGNHIKNVRTDIIRCGTPRILKHIRDIGTTNVNTLDSALSNASIDIYPDKYVMRNTKLLSLIGQSVVDLPKEILNNAKEAEVTTIDLSRNKLCELPKELFDVTTATDFKLTSNRISSLPESIENFRYLRMLDLSKNYLESLPATMCLLKYLRYVDISFNRFTELPDAIYNVTSLDTIIASDNSINNIDVPALTQLKNLATLDLTNNNINFVPPELGNLTNLRYLLLAGNCFKHPRQAILMKSTDEILAYLRTRIPS